VLLVELVDDVVGDVEVDVVDGAMVVVVLLVVVLALTTEIPNDEIAGTKNALLVL